MCELQQKFDAWNCHLTALRSIVASSFGEYDSTSFPILVLRSQEHRNRILTSNAATRAARAFVDCALSAAASALPSSPEYKLLETSFLNDANEAFFFLVVHEYVRDYKAQNPKRNTVWSSIEFSPEDLFTVDLSTAYLFLLGRTSQNREDIKALKYAFDRFKFLPSIHYYNEEKHDKHVSRALFVSFFACVFILLFFILK